MGLRGTTLRAAYKQAYLQESLNQASLFACKLESKQETGGWNLCEMFDYCAQTDWVFLDRTDFIMKLTCLAIDRRRSEAGSESLHP